MAEFNVVRSASGLVADLVRAGGPSRPKPGEIPRLVGSVAAALRKAGESAEAVADLVSSSIQAGDGIGNLVSFVDEISTSMMDLAGAAASAPQSRPSAPSRAQQEAAQPRRAPAQSRQAAPPARKVAEQPQQTVEVQPRQASTHPKATQPKSAATTGHAEAARPSAAPKPPAAHAKAEATAISADHPSDIQGKRKKRERLPVGSRLGGVALQSYKAYHGGVPGEEIRPVGFMGDLSELTPKQVKAEQKKNKLAADARPAPSKPVSKSASKGQTAAHVPSRAEVTAHEVEPETATLEHEEANEGANGVADPRIPDYVPPPGVTLRSHDDPAVPLRDSLRPEGVVCLEDGEMRKMLKRHLRAVYAMTPEQYRKRWNLPADYPMVAPQYAEQKSRFAKMQSLGIENRPEPRRKATSTRRATANADA